MPNEQHHLEVFLCHAHSNQVAVRELYRCLTRDGVHAWLDKEKLLPGQDWELEIRKAVRAADVVIICLSRQFDQAGFRQKEMRLVLDAAMEKPEGEIFIIPLRLEECDVPQSLHRWQWVDLFEKDGYDKLLRALQRRAEDIRAVLQIQKSWLPVNTPPRLEVKEYPKSQPPRYKAYKNRVLEAAIEKQVSVNVPASLFVWIRRSGSKSIITVVGSVDEDVVLNEDSVRSKELKIEFQVKDGRVAPASVSLRLVAHEFTPSVQQKEILVPPEGDSQVCTFIITPNKAGKLLLNLEVLKDQVSIATRSIHTTAIEAEKNAPGPMVSMSIPIIVFVQSRSIDMLEAKQKYEFETKQNTLAEKSEKNPSSKTNPAIVVALIGAFATIAAALITLFANMPVSPVVTPALTASLAPTVTDTSNKPTFTSLPGMDTPISATFTPVPPITLGQDWNAGCISTLWKPYPSDIPAMERGDGCWQEPVHVFSAEDGDLDFLADRKSGLQEIYGLFAPLPDSGTVTFTARLKELSNADLWMGVYAKPDVTSQGLLMVIPAGDVHALVIMEKNAMGYETAKISSELVQENGISISFTFTENSVRGRVNPSVFLTNSISVPSSQKWLFLGYKGMGGSYRIEGTFSNLELK